MKEVSWWVGQYVYVEDGDDGVFDLVEQCRSKPDAKKKASERDGGIVVKQTLESVKVVKRKKKKKKKSYHSGKKDNSTD